VGSESSGNITGVQTYRYLSGGRKVRIGATDAPIFLFCSNEHCGGLRTLADVRQFYGSTRSSVPTNIAEGCGRGSDAELIRFLVISMGSASELEYQVLLAKDLHYLASENYEELNEKILQLKKMINVFIQKVKLRQSNP